MLACDPIPSRTPLRPTFELDLPDPPDAVAEALAALMPAYPGQRAGHHFMLTVPPAKRHFWSPYLTIELNEAMKADELEGDADATSGGGGTRLHGRFSPHPSLWTAFGLSYLALLTLAGFAAIGAVAQAVLRTPPWALAVSGVCVLGVAGLWWFSVVGRRLAHDQMIELRQAVEQQLGFDGKSPRRDAALKC